MTLDWPLVLTIVGSNFALVLMGLGATITLFLWARTEAREDRKNDQERWETHRNEMMHILKAIQDESKEFHGKLCAIEERNRK